MALQTVAWPTRKPNGPLSEKNGRQYIPDGHRRPSVSEPVPCDRRAGPNTSGYSVRTTNVVSNDFGLTWALGDPRRGILPLADPFPIRADGTRYDAPVGNLFGAHTETGTEVTVPNLNREHPRVKRWRVSAQRELSRNTPIEIAYNGTYADRLSASIRQDYQR
jgi:hypothetical protein